MNVLFSSLHFAKIIKALLYPKNFNGICRILSNQKRSDDFIPKPFLIQRQDYERQKNKIGRYFLELIKHLGNGLMVGNVLGYE